MTASVFLRSPPEVAAPPWTLDETSACFILRDGSGQALACVYFDDEPGRRSAAKLLTRDEAWRIIGLSFVRYRCPQFST